MPLTLSARTSWNVPVSGESLRPDALAGLSADEVARRSLRVGNSEGAIGDLFTIAGDPQDDHLILEGDLSSVDFLGLAMTAGTLEIRGDAGSGVGKGMRGGTILVSGSVAHAAGQSMRGGLIRIEGSAGNGVGGASPGGRLGMREGIILVRGDIGHDAGLAMRRGLIAVMGHAGDGLGRAMIAGSIFTFGTAGRNPGLGMKRGTLALLGPASERIPATFAPSGTDRPPFLTIYLRALQDRGFPIPDRAFHTLINRYNGDLAERGQGEILAAVP